MRLAGAHLSGLSRYINACTEKKSTTSVQTVITLWVVACFQISKAVNLLSFICLPSKYHKEKHREKSVLSDFPFWEVKKSPICLFREILTRLI